MCVNSAAMDGLPSIACASSPPSGRARSRLSRIVLFRSQESSSASTRRWSDVSTMSVRYRRLCDCRNRYGQRGVPRELRVLVLEELARALELEAASGDHLANGPIQAAAEYHFAEAIHAVLPFLHL